LLELEDMLRIAEAQIAREQEAAPRANRFLFCDTSPLTTLFYSRHLFHRADPALERLAERPYDLAVLCAPDFPFVQDGTRQPASFRAHQHDWHLRELAARDIRCLLTSGPVSQRLVQVHRALSGIS
jgi:nicotinamide riboside kinase